MDDIIMYYKAMNCKNCQLFLATGAIDLSQLRATYFPSKQTIMR